MDEWLLIFSEIAIVSVNMMALLAVVLGAVQAFFAIVGALFASQEISFDLRHGYTRFARWLIVGLTFQMAADIIETASAQDWESIGRLAAIAVVRTFLSYFLERDLKEIAERNPENKAESAGE